MKQRQLVLALALLLFAGIPAAFAQSRAVTGKISDATGAGMMGVNVLVKGTNVGTTSNADGVYSINVPEGSNTLVYLSLDTDRRRSTSVDAQRLTSP
jgi:hypothetical protein